MLTKVYKMGDKLGIYFSKDKQLYKKGTICLLTIKKSTKKITFLTRFNYNIIIRKDFIEILKLKKGDPIDVNIEKVKCLRRSKELFHNNKIDLLSLIPKKTSQGYDMLVSKFMKNNKEWLKIWYSHNKGSGRQLELKRFIDSKKFGSLLGQYQAEGTKHKNTIKKFYSQFSNKLIGEHLNFLENLKEIGFPRDKTEFKLSYNPNKVGRKEINQEIEKFKTSINLKLKINIDKQNKGMEFSCIIRNTLLTEITLNSMNKIRVLLANAKKYSKNQKVLVDSFLAKLLTGDGTIDIRIKNRKYNASSTRIKITDGDKNYLKDYKRMMDNLGFISKIKSKDIFVRSYCSLHQLLYLYRIKAFKNTNNWNKLLLNIDLLLNGRRFSTLKRFMNLVKFKRFDTIKISQDYNVSISAAYDWLINATKKGYVEKITERLIPTIWTTTAKAEKLAKTLESWKQDLTKLKKGKRIQDSRELLDSLKVKN